MTRTTARAAAALLLAAVLAAGCSAPEAPPPGTSRSDTSPAATAPEAIAPAATTPAADPASPPVPVRTIPSDLVLPHEARWRTLGWPGRTPLRDVCLDPGIGGLYLPETTDYRAVGSGPRWEALGVYGGPGRADGALDAWREQARTCAGPGSVDHVGLPMEWVVEPVRVAGADEAWRAHLRTTVEGPDLGVLSMLLTVVRVGNAVYVVGDREPVEVSRLPERGASALASVTPFVPALGAFRSR